MINANKRIKLLIMETAEKGLGSCATRDKNLHEDNRLLDPRILGPLSSCPRPTLFTRPSLITPGGARPTGPSERHEE